MTDRPIVLVHGAWHGAWAWDPLTERLRAAGRDVTAVDLPSSGASAHSLGDLAADAGCVRATLDSIDGDKVLVGHSYGGQVISEASAGRGDVAHLVYVCAFMLDPGTSLLGLLDGEVPDWIELVADGSALRSHQHDVVFYADVDTDVAQAASERLELQSTASFAGELTGAGWREIDSTYIVCEYDMAIPPARQITMASNAGTVHRLASSHSPFLSMPDAVAAIVLAA